MKKLKKKSGLSKPVSFRIDSDLDRRFRKISGFLDKSPREVIEKLMMDWCDKNAAKISKTQVLKAFSE